MAFQPSDVSKSCIFSVTKTYTWKPRNLAVSWLKKNRCTYRYIRPEYLDVAEIPEFGRSRWGEPQEEQGKEGKSLHNRADAVARLSEPDVEENDRQRFYTCLMRVQIFLGVLGKFCIAQSQGGKLGNFWDYKYPKILQPLKDE